MSCGLQRYDKDAKAGRQFHKFETMPKNEPGISIIGHDFGRN